MEPNTQPKNLINTLISSRAIFLFGNVSLIVFSTSAINRGIVSIDAIEEIHRLMLKEIKQAGGKVEAVLYCPHRPEEDCECRKPRPGLLRKAASLYGLELERCYLVGDKLTDAGAGQAVGCQTILVRTGREGAQWYESQVKIGREHRLCQNITEAVAWILETEKGRREVADSSAV